MEMTPVTFRKTCTFATSSPPDVGNFGIKKASTQCDTISDTTINKKLTKAPHPSQALDRKISLLIQSSLKHIKSCRSSKIKKQHQKTAIFLNS